MGFAEEGQEGLGDEVEPVAKVRAKEGLREGRWGEIRGC